MQYVESNSLTYGEFETLVGNGDQLINFLKT
jgi:hypothetical protein